MADTCNYSDCEALADRRRRFGTDDRVFTFCSDHDPLEDPNVANRWEAADE